MIDYHGIRIAPKLLKPLASEEPDEIRMAIDHFDKNDVVLHGGVGFGLLHAVIMSVAKRCIGYEGNKLLCELVLANVRVDGKPLEIVQNILWSSPGVKRYHIAPHWAASRIDEEGNTYATAISIDNEVLRYTANALALDVEGAEWELLSTMDLSPINKILVEFHWERLLSENPNEHIYDSLFDSGLKPVESVPLEGGNRTIEYWAR